MHKARGLYGTEHPMYAHESTSTQARTRSLGTFGPASRIMPVLIVIAIARAVHGSLRLQQHTLSRKDFLTANATSRR